MAVNKVEDVELKTLDMMNPLMSGYWHLGSLTTEGWLHESIISVKKRIIIKHTIINLEKVDCLLLKC